MRRITSRISDAELTFSKTREKVGWKFQRKFYLNTKYRRIHLSLASTGVPSLDNLLGSDGYPDRSSILVVGAPGIGKEALGYWFVRSGLVQGDYCLYATHRPVSDVLRDMGGVGISAERVPEWIASSGSPIRLDLRDSTSISFNIKQAVHQNKQRRVRVATDILSPLLVLNSPRRKLSNSSTSLKPRSFNILELMTIEQFNTHFLLVRQE